MSSGGRTLAKSVGWLQKPANKDQICSCRVLYALAAANSLDCVNSAPTNQMPNFKRLFTYQPEDI